MNAFVAAYAGHDGDVARALVDSRLRTARARGLVLDGIRRTACGGFAAAWTAGRGSRVDCVVKEDRVTVGEARLENRRDILVMGEPVAAPASDLMVVSNALSRRGNAVISELLGRFAWVSYDQRNQRLVLARDTFGLGRLFFRWIGDDILVASHLDFLTDASSPGERYARSFLGDAMLEDPTISVWPDTSAVPHGSYVFFDRDDWHVMRYWPTAHSASTSTCAARCDDAEAASRFAELLRLAVRANIEDVPSVWCEVSGGLDSGAVFAIAHDEAKVAGAYTFLDATAAADQRPYIDAIFARRPAQRVTFDDNLMWNDDGEPPPRTDEPRVYYPSWSRDRRAERLVRSRGGTVVLSGGGADFYLAGNALVIADALASGRIGDAVRESHRTAARWQTTMWGFLWHFGIRPCFRAFLSRSEARGAHLRAYTLGQLDSISSTIELPVGDPCVEKRYPFLYRPLVDFALAVRSSMIYRDGTTKWLMREAERPWLPELVRTRASKGMIGARFCQALSRQHALVDRMMRDPLIAQAGWVDRTRIQQMIERTRAGANADVAPLMRALALETWLCVRTGRWAVVSHPQPR